ncbi:MAG TPA: preprotein translocase subunit SecY [Candidatus Norongarragalinales archaeon]|jgi:preprotein translocase subunit SecY|nr:preprotein translocase subunit SecY [Candidatus Norongarragalinales archaeon]
MVLEALRPITSALPEVKQPLSAVPLKEKLMWTAGALLIFYIMGQVYPLGANPISIAGFERIEILLGSRTGTLITAGIGPIVLASIFLQLAVGAKIINLDLSKPENKSLFTGVQKLLAIILAFFEGAIYSTQIAPLAVTPFTTYLGVVLQLALGSIVLIYLDEVVQRYGIGSGISLFIAAGVAQQIFVGAFSLAFEGGAPAGLIPQAMFLLARGDVANALWTLVPIVFTVLVFLLVVYVEGMKIELPLAFGKARGLGARYPIKFMYVSNIPVILAAAVLLNVQLFGMFLSNSGFPILGHYQSGRPIDGFAYYTTPLPSPLLLPGDAKYLTYLQLISTPNELLHILVYAVSLIILCVIFGWFWIESTGMGAKEVATQLTKVGLTIPGFRQDPRVLESVLQRYIPVITVLGSIFVGALAAFADITGALGTGTGILLTVGILYKFYEDLAQQQVFELYPALKKLVK